MKWNYKIDGIFLKQHTTQAFAGGNFNKVPLMVGLTRNQPDFSVQRKCKGRTKINEIILEHILLFIDQGNNTVLLHDLNPMHQKYIFLSART